MNKSRLEAFSDGVIAIIITIMVLELKVPHGADLAAISPLLPVFASYVLSFVYTGIYWNNHHHLLHVARRVTGSIMWANLHLLFWLSLVPFATGWAGENHAAALPIAAYGGVLFMAGVAYWILQRAILALPETDESVKAAFKVDFKGLSSPVFYAAAIGLAFVETRLSIALYVLVALMWLIPDPRIEKRLKASD
jgi:uncharacterized membrane protein